MANITKRDDGFWVVYGQNELQLETGFSDGPHKTLAKAEEALEGINLASSISRPLTSESDWPAPSERSMTD